MRRLLLIVAFVAAVSPASEDLHLISLSPWWSASCVQTHGPGLGSRAGKPFRWPTPAVRERNGPRGH